MARAISLTDNQKIRVESFKNDKGRFLNVRKFYKTKNDDEWKPAAQGMSIPEEIALKVLKMMKKELDEIAENAKELEPRKGKSDKASGKKGKTGTSTKKGKRNDD